MPSPPMPAPLDSKDLILRIRSDAIQPNAPLYYPESILRLLDHLRRIGMEHLEIFWPVGLTVLPPSRLAPPPPLREIVAWIAQREVRKLSNLDPLSEPFKRDARLLLLARFRTSQMAAQALSLLSKPNLPTRTSLPEIASAELVPTRGINVPKPAWGPTAKVDAAAAAWGKRKVAPHPEWAEYRLSNIGVLDSGCETSHPTFAPGAVTVYGSASDLSGHGTFVSGQLVGRGGGDLPKNHGMLPNSRIWLGNVAVPTSDQIDYDVDGGLYDHNLAILARTNESEYVKAGLDQFNIKVLNLSLGGFNYYSLEEYRIQELVAKGISVVACVHNMPGDEGTACVYYPAALPSVVSVGAVMDTGNSLDLWAKSRTQLNYRGWTLDTSKDPPVDLSAPGVNIGSSLPAHLGGSAILEGTSFAAPYVTAALSVLAVANKDLSPADLAKLLFAKVASLSFSGSGRGLLRCSDWRLPLKIISNDKDPIKIKIKDGTGLG